MTMREKGKATGVYQDMLLGVVASRVLTSVPSWSYVFFAPVSFSECQLRSIGSVSTQHGYIDKIFHIPRKSSSISYVDACSSTATLTILRFNCTLTYASLKTTSLYVARGTRLLTWKTSMELGLANQSYSLFSLKRWTIINGSPLSNESRYSGRSADLCKKYCARTNWK